MDDSFILKKIDITDKLISYSYQFEFEKSEISEEEWKDFIEVTKKEIERRMLSNAKESLPKVKISLSRILELADISLEYIYSDINGSIVGTIHLDYLDFYGMQKADSRMAKMPKERKGTLSRAAEEVCKVTKVGSVAQLMAESEA